MKMHGSSYNDSIENLQSTESSGSVRLRYHRKIRRFWFILLCQTITNLSIVGLSLVYFAREWRYNSKMPIEHPKSPFPQLLYSPVQHLVQYQTRVFHEGFGTDQSIYQLSPSPEVDAAWEDLYDFGISHITKEEASQLVNQTYRFPGHKDHYCITLDVFHQLHCLNMLRKALHPKYYRHNDHNHLDHDHLGHCIESIRESLMCSADVSPLVWQWVERKNGVRIMGNIIHVCRDYERIKEWGLERRLDHELEIPGINLMRVE